MEIWSGIRLSLFLFWRAHYNSKSDPAALYSRRCFWGFPMARKQSVKTEEIEEEVEFDAEEGPEEDAELAAEEDVDEVDLDTEELEDDAESEEASEEDEDEVEDEEEDAEGDETLDDLEAEELALLEDEVSETILVDEVAELRAIRREELTMDLDAHAVRGDEFVCQSCFLVKRTSQLANRRKMICRDCAS